MTNYYIHLGQAPSGPHTREQIEQMISGGQITSETLVVVEGGDNWQPARELFDFPGAAALPPAPAPPLPSAPQLADPYAPPGAALEEAPPASGLDFPLVFEGKVIPGTEGLTAGQVVELCRRGGRFVIWQYAVSIVVMSFRRTSGVRFLRPGQSGAGDCLKYSLISGAVGWWGIPWGIVFTLSSLFRNMSGGQDVTEPLLKGLVGSYEADQIIRRRKGNFNAGALVAGLTGLAIPVIIIFLIGSSAGARSERRSSSRRSDAGRTR